MEQEFTRSVRHQLEIGRLTTGEVCLGRLWPNP